MPGKIFITLLLVLGLLSAAAQAKGGRQQDQIILLNDAASAVEDSYPQLSKRLAQYAAQEEKEWEAQNVKGTPKPAAPMTAKAKAEEQGEIKNIKEAARDIAGTYPLIAKALDRMADDLMVQGLESGMQEADFLSIYPFIKTRDFRHKGPDDWLTYNEPLGDPYDRLITFHFHGGKMAGWKFDDRPEVVKEYLEENCFYRPPSLTYLAVKDVLERMPYKDFLSATRRARPMLFTEFYNEGTARFASSSEYILTKDDPPCCSEGFTIIKLGMSLGLAKTPGPIEGVVAHEIAHRVLNTIRKGNVNCDAERAANRLIIKWGFAKEFKEASQLFGQKKGDPAGCQEVPHKTNVK